MNRRLTIVAYLSVAAAGCDHPLGPAPGPSPPASPAITLREVTGVVRDARANPIAGATLTISSGGEQLVSNERGQFTITVARDNSTVSVAKKGYEPAFRVLVERTLDIVLHEVIRISVGQSVRVTVRPDDELDWFDVYRLRVVRVFSSETVTARIQVLADDNGPVHYWIRRQPCCGPTNDLINIPGGTETEIEVHIPWTSSESRTFTVMTSRIDS